MTIIEDPSYTIKTLAVSAIRNGTVIDHIPPGRGLNIVRLLKFATHGKPVTIALNLPSETMGRKDLIKIEDWEPTEELNQLALLAPQVKINMIRNFEVIRKFNPQIPDEIAVSKIFQCPNPKCISTKEPVNGTFKVIRRHNIIKLSCHFCRKNFTLEDMGFSK